MPQDAYLGLRNSSPTPVPTKVPYIVQILLEKPTENNSGNPSATYIYSLKSLLLPDCPADRARQTLAYPLLLPWLI